ncbi:ShlB/FhaC/HecB family hemolysin secretion/activation protein [Shewanella salipaludis]|uniref:ShlB/FhaC/HecB family hemolysin secretion/activation protein n=1 Tax=Shewanella salipaludis TaxID=2723052 RepID=A0A972G8V5_9GAMM|nr:ShlB/FhaC/HecB family hemolysin secretion/activation protein [Shewanella salipaludis]NMH66675.1 ShlB/FhaC/HecB family hemolysin secretion/activation protein [Shewanella salipaludis]
MSVIKHWEDVAVMYLTKAWRLNVGMILTLLCVAGSDAQAQNLSEHEKLLKQGLDRLEQQIAPLQQRPDVRLQRPESVITDFAALENAEQCFDITTISVQGSHKLGPKVIAQVTEPFVGQCLGLAHINALVAAISNLYLEQGYITSRAYIAPQDLSDGVLDLVVIEGVIEGFYSVDGSINQQQLNWAFPARPGEVLSIRALEHGIENLNSVGQNNARVDLNPGSEQGDTLVAIANQAVRPWRGSLGLNNNGVASTGEYQLDGNLVFDNVFGLNDTGFISASTNIGEHELPHAESRSYAASWSLPAGYWLFSLTNNYYAYEQTVVGNVIDFSISGSSLISGVQLGRNLYRSQTGKLDLSVGFTRKESKNYIEDIFLETSSRTLYVWDLTAGYRYFMPLSTLNLNAHILKSVPWFDAKRQLVEAEDDFQFTKYQLNLGINTNIELGGQSLLYAASAELLYSPKVILASEGLTVGGRYSVRGLSQSSLFGYKGGYLRNDISLPLQMDWPVLNQLQYFLGLDVGLSNLPEYPHRHWEWVAGSVVGVKLFDHNLSITASYARALRVPDFLQQKQQEIDFSVRLNF